MSSTHTVQRGSAEAKASSWLGWMWLLALVATMVGFLAFGNVIVDQNDQSDFNAGAAFLGGALGFVLVLPWIGVFSVLEAIARSAERRTTSETAADASAEAPTEVNGAAEASVEG